MNSLEEVKPLVEKPKRQRKPKAQPVLEPIPEPVVEPVQEPEPLPKSEPEVVCEDCGEPIAFSEAEMDIYRKINAHKRKLLRLKKALAVNVEV